MNKIKSHAILHWLEILGLATLILVLLALATFNVPVLSGTKNITSSTILMIILVVISAFTSFFKLINRRHLVFSLALSICLLGMGGYVFFFLPGFFYHMIWLNTSFWYKVSIYSLPAICVEGGLLTLFNLYFDHKAQQRTSRERTLVLIAFVLYAVIAITTNFLVLLSIIPISSHLLFSRIIIVSVIMIMTAFFYKSKKP